jgi:hypothetical protein
MIRNLLVGLPLMLVCLIFQAYFISVCVRQYGVMVERFSIAHRLYPQMWLLATVMFLMLFSNFSQMAAWALAFVLIDEFDSFSKAMYHSAVNFATLGYGDIVLSERWRILGPMEAATGILMFGVSTSAMTATIVDLMQRNRKPRDAG